MILSDTTIAKMIKSGEIIILPKFDPKNIRPAGIRLHLDNKIMVAELGQTVDLSGNSKVNYKTISISEEGYTLNPGDFILASTYERFQVPRDIVCHLDGRSTVARLGLTVHCTAAVVDGNFDEPRTVTFEMKNLGPLRLIIKPQLAVALLTFTKLSAPIAQESQLQYKGQNGVAAPNLEVQKR